MFHFKNFFMASGQTLARFFPSSNLDFYKCLKLAEKIECERNKNANFKASKQQIRNLKRGIDVSSHQGAENLTLSAAETLARENNFRLRIWKQETYRKPVFLEFESQIEDTNFTDFNLFRNGFIIFCII